MNRFTNLLSFLILISCGISMSISAQTTFSGTITNSDGTEPVERASVYVSGSTNGTYSNSQGRFKLSGIITPCQVVISHLGYGLKVINLRDDGLTDMMIRLTEKERKLSEVNVSGKSHRPENISSFRKAFLGEDNWGWKAVLLNDSDLIFSRQVDTLFEKSFDKVIRFNVPEKGSVNQSDSARVDFKKVISTLSVTSKAPLMVDLPLLGYRASVDLVNFVLIDEGLSSYNSLLGYFLYQPYESKTKSKQKTYEHNRQKVYYNSPMHFVRSLYVNALTENGYVVFRNQFMVPDSILTLIGAEEALIHGQKGNEYRIVYHGGANGKPLDLSMEKDFKFKSVEDYVNAHSFTITNETTSQVLFLSDTCKIRSNGTTPDNTILFKGLIGAKKVGAMLPDDYKPDATLIPTVEK